VFELLILGRGTADARVSIEYHIVWLQGKQLRLSPEGDCQTRVTTHTAECLPRGIAQLTEAGGTEVGQLVLAGGSVSRNHTQLRCRKG
jgi:hypothetical protein